MSNQFDEWLRIVVVFGVLGTLTVGAGYLIGIAMQRVQAPRWAGWVCGALAALLPPVLLLGLAAYSAATYRSVGPDDPGDLPGLALAGVVVLSPVLVLVALPFALLGVHWSRRRKGGGEERRFGAPPT